MWKEQSDVAVVVVGLVVSIFSVNRAATCQLKGVHSCGLRWNTGREIHGRKGHVVRVHFALIGVCKRKCTAVKRYAEKDMQREPCVATYIGNQSCSSEGGQVCDSTMRHSRL